MEWFSQNWTWIVLVAAIGLLFLGQRRGLMGGCGAHHGGHEKAGGQSDPGNADVPTPVPGQEAGEKQPNASARHTHRGCC